MAVLFFIFILAVSVIVLYFFNRSAYNSIDHYIKSDLKKIKKIYQQINMIDPQMFLPYNTNAVNILCNNASRIANIAYSVVKQSKSNSMVSKRKWVDIYSFCTEFLKGNKCAYDKDEFLSRLKVFAEKNDNIYDLYLIPLALKVSLLVLLYDRVLQIQNKQSLISRLDRIHQLNGGNSMLEELCKNKRQVYNLCTSMNNEVALKYSDALNSASMFYGISVNKICDTYKQEDVALDNEIISLFNALLDKLPDMDDLYDVCETERLFTKMDESYRISDAKTRVVYRSWLKRYSKKANIDEIQLLDVLGDLIKSKQGVNRFAGYYLTGDGQSELNKTLGISLITSKAKRNVNTALYFIMLFCMYFTASWFLLLFFNGISAFFKAILLLLVIPSILLNCKTIIDKLVMRFTNNVFLPVLNDKYADTSDTAVVVPALISSIKKSNKMIDKIEMISLSNPGFSYVLLCDFSPRMSDGEEIEEIKNTLRRSIDGLNKKYGGGFAVFIRDNAVINGQKMPKERKRGALGALCDLIINKNSAFADYCGEKYVNNVKYIFTVDEDTVISAGTARKLVCGIKHPLNRNKNNVARMIQPMMITGIPYNCNSYFSAHYLCSGNMPSYPCAFGDVFSRLFNKSAFGGKGIFDVESYLSAYKKLPENKILSHDQPEGDLLNCILYDEAVCAEHVPENAEQYFSRDHRWMRGDWQNLFFLIFSKKHSAFFKLCTIFNCIFSLSELGICVYFIMLMAFLPNWFLSGMIIFAIIGADVIIKLLKMIAFAIMGARTKHQLCKTIDDLVKRIVNLGYYILLLPCKAAVSFDAIATTVGRVFITGKNLLQWDNRVENENTFARFWSAPFFGLLLLVLAVYHAKYVVLSALLLAVFGFAPVFYNISARTKKRARKRISGKEHEVLLALAAKTLCYFVDSMSADNNYLPPDNYQLEPFKGFCNRTSVTNIGFGVLAIACSYKLGLLPSCYVLDLLEKSVASIEKLEKYNGCHYNWYNIKELKPLGRFVSAVDCGNFCACLLASSQMLKNKQDDIDSQTAIKIRVILESCSNEHETADYKFLNDYNIIGLKDFLYNIDTDALDGCAAKIIKQWQKSLLMQNKDLSNIAKRLEAMALSENLSALYDHDKKLFHIGYDTAKEEYTDSCYDLFASENLLCSYFALCSGQIPSEHWYALDRKIVNNRFGSVMLSWSGTVFENYMPLIFLETEKDTLLGIAADKVMQINMDIADRASTPFGISESCCADLNSNGDYVYQAFGVEELALDTKESSPVFAPYASIMAIEYYPEEVFANIVKFTKLGMVNKYGFFESLDYRYQSPTSVKCFMSHHQGMIISSLTNYLCDSAVRNGFMRFPNMKAGRLLLYEDIPYSSDTRITQKHIDIADIEAPHLYCSAARIKSGRYTFDISNIGFGFMYDDITVVKLPQNEYCRGGRFYYCDSGKYTPIVWNSIYAGFCNIMCSTQINGVIIQCEIVPLNTNNGFVLNFSLSNERHNGSRIALGADVILDREVNYYAHPQYSNLFVRSILSNDYAISFIYKYGGELSCAAAIKCNCANVEYYTDRDSFYDIGSIYSIDPCYCESSYSNGEKMLGAVAESYDGEIVFELLAAGSEDVIRNKMLYNSYSMDELRVYAQEGERLFMLHNKLNTFEAELYLQIAQGILLGSVKKINKAVDRDAYFRLGLSGDNKNVVLITDDISRIRSVLKVISAMATERIDIVVLVSNENSVTEQIISVCNEYNMRDKGKAVAICGDGADYISAAFCVIDGDGNCQLYEYKKADKHMIGNFSRSYLGIQEGFCADGFNICSSTMRPWSNVLTNGNFGCVVCNDGAGFTFGNNAAVKKLTKQPTDRVKNVPSEIVYLKNERGDVWTVTPKPINLGDEHAVKHGFGYSTFYYNGFGIKCEQTVFVAINKNIKFYILLLENISDADQMITIGFYTDAFIGERYNRDKKYCAYSAENEYAVCYNGRDSVYLMGGDEYGTSKDAFLRGGLAHPSLDISKDGWDCICAKKKVLLKSGCTNVVYFCLSDQYLDDLAKIDPEVELENVTLFYEGFLDKITFTTESDDLDVFLTKWLPYQTYNSRFLARCGYYQAGGAFGFRDQLQDCLALMYFDTKAVEEHIVRCASHQFEYGDVQHWWHSDTLGVRTQISDDRLWLVYVACKYAEFVGNADIFTNTAYYLKGNEAPSSAEYAEFEKTLYSESIYQHCKRALKVSMTCGKHGLPLMMGGDWNDGMDEIGIKGEGESVWLGWFTLAVADMFEPYVVLMKDDEFAREITQYCKKLLESLEDFAWRGDRYLRAVADNNALIGDATSTACRLDSISQSWAVLSGFCDEERGHKCLMEAYKRLYDDKKKIFKLFYPPFGLDDHRAGYINDYPQGVRENGGQYTHGAVWFARALLCYGYADKAWNILKCCIPFMRGEERLKEFGNEPYVVSADIYLSGFGGWSWYTGAAGWLYTTVLEYVFGVRISGNIMRIMPCIPSEIKNATVRLKWGDSVYKIIYKNPFLRGGGNCRMYLNGKKIDSISLEKEGGEYEITVIT